MLLASRFFIYFFKTFRTFNSVNIGSVDQRTSKVTSYKSLRSQEKVYCPAPAQLKQVSPGQGRIISKVRWPDFNFSHFLKKNSSAAIFEQFFQPKWEPWDLDEPCFPYTFCPGFIPSIGFWCYSSKNSNPFLAHYECVQIFMAHPVSTVWGP